LQRAGGTDNLVPDTAIVLLHSSMVCRGVHQVKVLFPVLTGDKQVNAVCLEHLSPRFTQREEEFHLFSYLS
jgi:hypothetical protein